MDLFKINMLIEVLNQIKLLYDIADQLDEEIFRPIMIEAVNLARTLRLPYESDNDGDISQWFYINEKELEKINILLIKKYQMDGAS